MKSPKLILLALAAAALLGTLATSASAGRLSVSEQVSVPGWTRAVFSGGIGTVECEILLGRILHGRTFTKTRGSLIGYIESVEVERCSRGGATLLEESLPWHIQYDSFGGTLPNITAIRTLIIGLSLRIREPTFGIICLARSTATEPALEVYNISGGVIQSHTIGGTIRCGSFSGALSGTSSVVSPRVTLTLI